MFKHDSGDPGAGRALQYLLNCWACQTFWTVVLIYALTAGGEPVFEVKLLLGDRLIKRQVAATKPNE